MPPGHPCLFLFLFVRFSFPFCRSPFSSYFFSLFSFCRFPFVSCIAFAFLFASMLFLADSVILARCYTPPRCLSACKSAHSPCVLSSFLRSCFLFILFSSLPSLFSISIWTSFVSGRLLCKIFEVQKWIIFAPSVCDFIFELPRTSVESYARLHAKTSISLFSYYTETTRTTYQV